MPKYTHGNLATLIKLDAKNIKRTTSRKLDLSVIQNELSKLLGYRHYSELEKANNPPLKGSGYISLENISQSKVQPVKADYKLYITLRLSQHFQRHHKSLFDKLEYNQEYVIENTKEENKIIKEIDLNEGNHYFELGLQELKALVRRKLESNKLILNNGMTLIDMNEIYVNTYLNIVFKVVKKENSNDLISSFFHYLTEDNLEKYVNENKYYFSGYVRMLSDMKKEFGSDKVQKYLFESLIELKDNVLFKKGKNKVKIDVNRSIRTEHILEKNDFNVKYIFTSKSNQFLNYLIDYVKDRQQGEIDLTTNAISYGTTASGMSFNLNKKSSGLKIVAVGEIENFEDKVAKPQIVDCFLIIGKLATKTETLKKIYAMNPDIVYISKEDIGGYYEMKDLKQMEKVGFDVFCV
tara:strand:+ start:55475 stop:56698 length:1224 start_codon:yes stop_codon:yes gene_type:complete